MPPNGWTKNEALVKFREDTLEKQVERIFELLWDMNTRLVRVEVKAGIWGGVCGGAVAALIVYFIRGG